MAHFVGYNTEDATAGKLTSVGTVKATINNTVKAIEIEEPTGVPLQQSFYVLVDKEWMLATKSGYSRSAWTLERAQRATKAAEHKSAAEIFVANQSEFVPLQAEQELVLGPLQTDRAEKITGSVWSEQKGAVTVQQSFDGGVTWDVAAAEVKFEAKEAKSFEIAILAPVSQIKFVNGASETKKLRLYARAAFQQGK